MTTGRFGLWVVGVTVPVAAAALALACAPGSLASGGALPQPIYFFSSTINPINAQNPLVMRPAGFLTAEDGSSDIQGLRWTGWGTSVARATGISSASNGIPNMAQGKRIKTPVQVTLSNPGSFQGHEVYRCFQLTVPSHPASDQPICLTKLGSVWGLGATTRVTPGAATGAGALTYTAFFSPIRNQACALLGTPGGGTQEMSCLSLNPLVTATLLPSGQVTICRGAGTSSQPCFMGTWTDRLGQHGIGADTPTLREGQRTDAGPYQCSSAKSGVTCVLIRSGKGFLLNSAGVTSVGP